MRKSDRLVLLSIIILLLLVSLWEIRIILDWLDWLELPDQRPLNESVGTTSLAFCAGVAGWVVWVWPGRDR